MTTQHTAGPWHRNIKPATHYNTIFAGRNTHVAHLAVQGKSEEEVEANCALIVAAPDLLAALQMVGRIWSNDQTANIDPESPLAIVRAAIAKATGGVA